MNKKENTPTNKAKLNKPLLIAFIIGILYLVYSFFYWSGAASSSASSAEQLGAGLATVLVMPHLIMTALAVQCTWPLSKKKRLCINRSYSLHNSDYSVPHLFYVCYY